MSSRSNRETEIVVLRLDPSLSELWLRDTFAQYGTLIHMERPVHHNGMRKALAYIQYATRDEAYAAVSGMSISAF
jgi:RNA recognition motif-containing protein